MLERAAVLDGPAELGCRLAGRLPHGPVRDVLSGTPLGHPLHPVLVTVPMGAFVGASFLDLTGGDEEASRRVDTTAFQRPPSEWADACAESDLAQDVPYAVTVEDMPVVLVRHGDALRALGNRCTHRGGPLSGGPVADGCIECPWHGSRFDLTDGAVVRGPATRPQMVVESRVVDGRVQVRRSEVRTLRLNPTS